MRNDILTVYFYGGENMAVKLFDEDLYSKDYKELADWIVACRNVVDKNLCRDDEDYAYSVDAFCAEWEEHYNWHNATYEDRSIYKSETFRMALAYIGYIERLAIEIDYGSGIHQIPYAPNEYFRNYISWDAGGYIDTSFRKFYDEIQAIFKPENKDDYKQLLHNIISAQSFCDYRLTYKALNKNGEILKTKTFDEFIEICEQDELYHVESSFFTKEANYNKALQNFDISKSTYNEFRHPDKCEKDFDKKMFVNLAFILGVGYDNAELLLNYNGYTLESNTRQFDVVCKKAFKIGFSREMAIALIEKKNYELAKTKKSFKMIPNLMMNKR